LEDKICKQENIQRNRKQKKKWSALSLGRSGQIAGVDMGQNCLMRLEKFREKAEQIFRELVHMNWKESSCGLRYCG